MDEDFIKLVNTRNQMSQYVCRLVTGSRLQCNGWQGATAGSKPKETESF